jgi:hypothetical protein
MKLAPDALQHLYDLGICTNRPQDTSVPLVKAGLAVAGKGRFGEYVRITDKGRQHLNALPERTRDELAIGYCNGVTKDALEQNTRRIARQAGVVIADSPTPSNTPPTEPLKAGATKYKPRTAAPGSSVDQTASRDAPPRDNPGRARRPTRRETTPKAVPPAPRVTPNALRVISGAKAIYYPIGTKVSHGEVRQVFTRNKFFKPYNLAAPECVADVLL